MPDDFFYKLLFTAYKEELEKNEHQQDTPETLLDAIEKHEKEIKDKETSTSLLNFIKEKKMEKQRIRQEKFDARKKRDEERRKAKDDEKRKRKESQKAEIAKNKDRREDESREKKYGNFNLSIFLFNFRNQRLMTRCKELHNFVIHDTLKHHTL